MERSLESPETPRVTKSPIILLHGTWGRGLFPKRQDEGSREDSSSREGTRWFEKGSQFRKGLEAQLKGLPLDYSLRWFCWSGANSIFERNRAATKLATELKADLKDRSATPIIIAHSHGGNVALRALSQLEDASRVRLVTLATPFLRVFVRDSFQFPFFVWLVLWAATAGIASGLVLLALQFGMFAIKQLTGTDLGDKSFWILIGGLAAAILASILIASWLPSIVAKRGRALEILAATTYPTVGASGPQMLVIRGVDDEAALSLAAGSIGSRLSALFLFIVIPMVLFSGVGLLALFDRLGVQTGLLLFIVMDGAALAALILLFLPGICKSAFGREFVTTAFICEIAAESAPDTSGRIDAVTLSPIRGTAGQRMRHRLYDHPECVSRIVHWLRTVV